MAKSGHRDADWRNWDALTPLLLETAKANKMLETKVMTVTELELQTFCCKKNRKTAPRASRVEQTLLKQNSWTLP